MTTLIEWVRFLAGAAFLLGGIAIFAIEMVGVFRFRYVLNRMHAAAMGDTLGLGCCLLGLIVMSGLNFTSMKLFLVILFLWFSSPVSSHLIARLEVATDEEREKHYGIRSLDHDETQKSDEAADTPDTVETQRTGSDEPEDMREMLETQRTGSDGPEDMREMLETQRTGSDEPEDMREMLGIQQTDSGEPEDFAQEQEAEQ